MNSNVALMRLTEFQVESHRRKVAQIRTMIAEFDRLAAELDREILAEETRSGKNDPTHFAYPTYAKAARARRDNLKRSGGELAAQLEAEQRALDHAIADRDTMAPTMLAPVEPAAMTFDLHQAS